MPAQWTGELIGEMHLKGITAKQLAAEAGWHPKYLSAVLNGHRTPKNAEETLRQAMLRLEIKHEREQKGLSSDLHALVEQYRATCPEYADKLEKVIGCVPTSSE